MESLPRALVLGVAAPVVAATAALWVLWRRDSMDPRVRERWTIVVLALIFSGAWVAGFGVPWPVRSGRDWMLPMTLGGAALALLGTFAAGHVAIAAGWVLRAGVLVGGMYLIARTRLASGWALGEALPLMAGFAAAGLAAGWSLGRAGREAGGLTPILAVLAVSMTSAVAALTGNITQAIQPAILCAVVGPALLVSVRRPGVALGDGASWGGAFLAGAWFSTSALGETPWLLNALAAGSVVLVGVSGLGAMGRLRGVKAWIVRGVVVGTPGVAAVAWAGYRVWEASRDAGYDY
ncbi:MAG: hypothetical protein HBSAPP03_14290 [Phycisphaerae bacterium]|nr:MAG: hypothetical protein HBSAPP03_14290 [Phycisphaerae bacterium]